MSPSAISYQNAYMHFSCSWEISFLSFLFSFSSKGTNYITHVVIKNVTEEYFRGANRKNFKIMMMNWTFKFNVV